MHGQSDASLLAEPMRRTIQAIDADLPVFGVKPLRELMSQSMAQRRFATTIVAAFAGVALLLAGIGIYGVMALSVSKRTREIGVRIALGAGRFQILTLIMQQGLALTGMGLGVGLLGALVLSRYLRSLLFDTSPLDPLTFGLTTVLLGAVALVACWLPAYRATKVEPTVALRME